MLAHFVTVFIVCRAHGGNDYTYCNTYKQCAEGNLKCIYKAGYQLFVAVALDKDELELVRKGAEPA